MVAAEAHKNLFAEHLELRPTWLVGVAAVVGRRGGVVVTVVVRYSPYFNFQ